MRTAQADGELQIFNRAYRQYRISRTAAGQPAMTFTIARSRLRQAIADTAAGRALGPGIIKRILLTETDQCPTRAKSEPSLSMARKSLIGKQFGFIWNIRAAGVRSDSASRNSIRVFPSNYAGHELRCVPCRRADQPKKRSFLSAKAT